MKIAPRFPLEFPVVVCVPVAKSKVHLKREKRIKGRSENLSMSGLGIDLSSHAVLTVGTELTVKLELDDDNGVKRELTFKAKVAWNQDSRLGLHIQAMSADERAFYESMIMGYQTLCRGFAGLQAVG